jgi:hypothetical protein
MEGVDRNIFPVPEESEDIDNTKGNSLVLFFEGLTSVDMNSSMRSYLSSQGSHGRPKERSKLEEIGTLEGSSLDGSSSIKDPSSGTNSQAIESYVKSSSGSLEVGGSRMLSEHSSSRVVLESGSVAQVVQGLQELTDIVLHAQDTFARCGLRIEPLASLNDFLLSTQTFLKQLLESFINGRGLLKRSAKLEIVKVALKSNSRVASSLLDIVRLLVKEAMYVNHMKCELTDHQKVLLEEQAELQRVIKATKQQFAAERVSLYVCFRGLCTDCDRCCDVLLRKWYVGGLNNQTL